MGQAMLATAWITRSGTILALVESLHSKIAQKVLWYWYWQGGAAWWRRNSLCSHRGLGLWTHRSGRGTCNFFFFHFHIFKSQYSCQILLLHFQKLFCIFAGCFCHRRVLPLEQMWLCHLYRGQLLSRWSGVPCWWELWHQMEGYVLPSQHCPAELVRCSVSLWYKLIQADVRYLTVGNHDHHYDHEWYQVEHSFI